MGSRFATLGQLATLTFSVRFPVYRNWMNSLGVNPYVNYLYSDLYDGLIMFQIFDIIQPGIVNWKRVVK